MDLVGTKCDYIIVYYEVPTVFPKLFACCNKEELDSILNKSSPLFSMVKKWTIEFKLSQTSISGHPAKIEYKNVKIHMLCKKIAN